MSKHFIVIITSVLLASACAASLDATEGPESCTPGEACACTAGEFMGCDGDSAQFCNAAGTGIATQTCGAPGCNPDAERCNVCEPSSTTCSADRSTLEHCGADGVPKASEVCALGCVAETPTSTGHCAYLEPVFLPDVCDTKAAQPSYTLTADTLLNTNADAMCTGGIATQTSGPEICVIRYGTINIDAKLTVRGSRALALVADDTLLVPGTLDVSADGAANGPGGGFVISGSRAATALGGGGAGFVMKGADGGSSDPAGGGGAAGGSALDPLATPVRFVGGPRPDLPTFSQVSYPASGGGGGAVTLIACRGGVSVSGTIDAGGGAGGGGRDTNYFGGQVSFAGGAGGGAGGYVVLQGATVRVTSPSGSGVFANGGGGGGGCTTDGCVGNAGIDGLPWTIPSPGGGAKDQGANGGYGGAAQGPTVGLASYYSPGGGGGAQGRLQTFTPMTGTVTISSTNSPAFEANRNIATR